MLEPVETEDDQPDEESRVILRRFNEARDAGLSHVEARLFAESDADVGVLRKLVKGKCDPRTIARILI